MVKYIFITGGVVSGLGKGITSASLGLLLKSRGYKVTMQKFDPYINFDAGTMNPIQHGECFVTDDGAETDLDLGHYERFINESLNQNSNITTGRIYYEVMQKERKGDYHGNTVQVIPHITNQIISHFYKEETPNDDVTFCLIEIGGTVGDMESEPYIEAVRQFRNQLPKNDTILIHVALIPFLEASKELKTKPVQQSVKMLQERGLQADIIILRSDYPIDDEIRAKISLFCNVRQNHVFENLNMESIYEVPLQFHALKIDETILDDMNVAKTDAHLEPLNKAVFALKNPEHKVKIAIVGKYTKLHDAYLSVVEALHHGGIDKKVKTELVWVESTNLNENNIEKKLANVDGILVPGGFGERGIEGMILACKYAREHNIPFLGLCLGLQVSVIEFARDVLNYKDANSTEFNKKTANPVICLLGNQDENGNIGGTLRLGAYDCKLRSSSICYSLYNQKYISERHRHRYEVNPKYITELEEKGLKIVGTNTPTGLVEFIENTNCTFYIATQAHPELKSRILQPHPLFKGFVEACLNYQNRCQK